MARRDTVMQKPKDTRGALTRLLAMLGPFRWMILLVAVLCVTSNLLSLLGPRLAGSAISEAAAGKGMVNFERVTYFAVPDAGVLRVLLPADHPDPHHDDERLQALRPRHAAEGLRQADAPARGLFRPAPGRRHHQPRQLRHRRDLHLHVHGRGLHPDQHRDRGRLPDNDDLHLTAPVPGGAHQRAPPR